MECLHVAIKYFSTYYLKYPTRGKPSEIKFSALIRSEHCFAYVFARRTVLKKKN